MSTLSAIVLFTALGGVASVLVAGLFLLLPEARREALRARGIKDRIQHRRNKHQVTLPRWQIVRNKLIGRVRTAVERTFSQLKGRYGLERMRYRGLVANAFHLDLVLIAFNLRTATRA